MATHDLVFLLAVWHVTTGNAQVMLKLLEYMRSVIIQAVMVWWDPIVNVCCKFINNPAHLLVPSAVHKYGDYHHHLVIDIEKEKIQRIALCIR